MRIEEIVEGLRGWREESQKEPGAKASDLVYSASQSLASRFRPTLRVLALRRQHDEREIDFRHCETEDR